MFDLKEHLRTLVNTHAPSGYEAPLRDLLRDQWTGWVDEFDQDRLGNLIAIKRGTQTGEPRHKIMLAAHMDEIALMVRDKVDGFIYVRQVGGLDSRLMLGQPVMVHGREPLAGIVAVKPPHLMTATEKKQYPKIDQVVIDLGLPADEVQRLVRIGDLITLDTPMIELNDNLMTGKALDDRACLAAVSYALHDLQSINHHWDVYATATVQEEVGMRGAGTAATYIQPDLAIALDVGFAEQSGVPADASMKINAGAAIALGANIHPKLFDQLISVAKVHEIPYQIEPMPANTGTDAWTIQVAHEGIPTALLSIPIRNMHSPIETVDLRDIRRTGRLLSHLIASLDRASISQFTWDEMPVSQHNEE